MLIVSDIVMMIVFIIFASSLLVQLFYYIFIYLQVWLFRNSEIRAAREPVSVIICARNEEENLRKFLPSVLEQDYPDFEVIVVNDCSEDNTFEVLGEYLGKYSHLRVSSIAKDPKFTHSKKFAQFIGIKAAKNELLLFTDADCKPESDKWLSGMISHFDAKTDFVLGYGGYFRGKGFLNKYIRYECITIAMQYLGMAIRGIPYMGVGRNLAYRKSVFFLNKGFSSHSHIVSGDDDLFVNANANNENTKVEFRCETHTRSVPPDDLKGWFKQKKRHLTTADHYKLRDKLLLIAEPASRILFYASFIMLLSGLFLLPFVVAGFVIRLITQNTVYHLAAKKLNEAGLLQYLIFFDIFSPIIIATVYFSNLRSGSGRNIWK